MTYRELNALKINCYENYIEQRYGKEELENLRYAITDSVKRKIMKIRSAKKVDETLINLKGEQVGE